MNEVILITGTSGGFGRAAVETLAEPGHQLFAAIRDIARRNAATAEAQRSLATARNWKVDVLEMDVSNEMQGAVHVSKVAY